VSSYHLVIKPENCKYNELISIENYAFMQVAQPASVNFCNTILNWGKKLLNLCTM
jgi:hypothetical protein